MGQGLVDAVIEVFVVREDDMASDIVKETFGRDIGGGQTAGGFIGVDDQP